MSDSEDEIFWGPVTLKEIKKEFPELENYQKQIKTADTSKSDESCASSHLKNLNCASSDLNCIDHKDMENNFQNCAKNAELHIEECIETDNMPPENANSFNLSISKNVDEVPKSPTNAVNDSCQTDKDYYSFTGNDIHYIGNAKEMSFELSETIETQINENKIRTEFEIDHNSSRNSTNPADPQSDIIEQKWMEAVAFSDASLITEQTQIKNISLLEKSSRNSIRSSDILRTYGSESVVEKSPFENLSVVSDISETVESEYNDQKNWKESEQLQDKNSSVLPKTFDAEALDKDGCECNNESQSKPITAFSDTNLSTEHPQMGNFSVLDNTFGDSTSRNSDITQPESVITLSDSSSSTEQLISQAENISILNSTLEDSITNSDITHPQPITAFSDTGLLTEQPKTEKLSNIGLLTEHPKTEKLSVLNNTLEDSTRNSDITQPEPVVTLSDSSSSTEQLISQAENISILNSTLEDSTRNSDITQPEPVTAFSDTRSSTEQPKMETLSILDNTLKDSTRNSDITQPEPVTAFSDTRSSTEQPKMETLSVLDNTLENSTRNSEITQPEPVTAFSDTRSSPEQPKMETLSVLDNTLEDSTRNSDITQPEPVTAFSDTRSSTEQPKMETVSVLDNTLEDSIRNSDITQSELVTALSDTRSSTKQPKMETLSVLDNTLEDSTRNSDITHPESITAFSDTGLLTEQPKTEKLSVLNNNLEDSTRNSDITQPEPVTAFSDTRSSTEQPQMENLSVLDNTLEASTRNSDITQPEPVTAFSDTRSSTEQPQMENISILNSTLDDSTTNSDIIQSELVTAFSDNRLPIDQLQTESFSALNNTLEGSARKTDTIQPELVTAFSDSRLPIDQLQTESFSALNNTLEGSARNTDINHSGPITTFSDTGLLTEQLKMETLSVLDNTLDDSTKNFDTTQPEPITVFSDANLSVEQPQAENVFALNNILGDSTRNSDILETTDSECNNTLEEIERLLKLEEKYTETPCIGIENRITALNPPETIVEMPCSTSNLKPKRELPSKIPHLHLTSKVRKIPTPKLNKSTSLQSANKKILDDKIIAKTVAAAEKKTVKTASMVNPTRKQLFNKENVNTKINTVEKKVNDKKATQISPKIKVTVDNSAIATETSKTMLHRQLSNLSIDKLPTKETTPARTTLTPAKSKDINTQFKTPTVSKVSKPNKTPNIQSANKLSKNIVSPIGMYIKQTPQAPLIVKIRQPIRKKTVDESPKKFETNITETPTQTSTNHTEKSLPFCAYKSASRVEVAEEKSSIPKSIKKFFPPTASQCVIKHESRIKKSTTQSPRVKRVRNVDDSSADLLDNSQAIFNASLDTSEVSFRIKKPALRP